MSYYIDNFVNNTQTFQINDARQIPIVIPTSEQLKAYKMLFDRAYEIKKLQFQNIISPVKAESELADIQHELDKTVEELYTI